MSPPTERRENEIDYKSTREQYTSYKENYVKYLQFDPEEANQSQHFFLFAKAEGQICVSGVLVDQHTPMGEVFIFLNTATYDEFERVVKVNVTA